MKYFENTVDIKRLRNLITLIDEEESKENYEDIDTDAVLEYTEEILNVLRNILF